MILSSNLFEIILTSFGAIFSMLIIWKASEGFEIASKFIGRNLSEGVRGATINAIASSIPELLTTLFFLVLLKDAEGFAGGIGTTAGSAIFNGMVIPSLAIFVVLAMKSSRNSELGVSNKIKVSRKVILRDGIALILCEILLITVISGEFLDWYHGLILMGAYLLYLFVMFRIMNKSQDGQIEDSIELEREGRIGKTIGQALFDLDLDYLINGNKKINTKNAWILLLFSIGIIAFACFLLVFSCRTMGTNIGVSTYIVAVLIASAATSVPDTLISMRDAKDGNYDDAISNALGSNIFDICFALGLPLFLYTVIYNPIPLNFGPMGIGEEINELRVLLLGFTIVAFLIYILGKYMNYLKAILLFGIYILFTLYIIGKARSNPITIEISEFIQNIFVL